MLKYAFISVVAVMWGEFEGKSISQSTDSKLPTSNVLRMTKTETKTETKGEM